MGVESGTRIISAISENIGRKSAADQCGTAEEEGKYESETFHKSRG
jgi:hypothetical protein